MKELYLMMSEEEVGRNFQRGNFNVLTQKKVYENDLLSVKVITIELENSTFQFTETFLKNARTESYSLMQQVAV